MTVERTIFQKGCKMKKIIILAACLASATWATDFSQINTEELIKMRGSVPVEERSAFRDEMQKRMQTMTPEQRQQFMQRSPGKGQNMGKGMGMGMGKGMNAQKNKGMRNRPTFATYDLDNDGKITQQEFNTAHAKRMKQKANEGKILKNAGNAPTFESIDTDKDGTVSPTEFTAHQMNQRKAKQMPRYQ